MKPKINLKNLAIKQREERKWKNLIDAIMDGLVIPVIGPDFLTEVEGKPVNHHRQLVDVISDACGLTDNPTTFSQLIHSKQFQEATDNNDNTEDVIYNILPDIIDQILDQDQLQPYRLLKKLLRSKLFPFVITTSFSPVVENVMKEVYGNDVKVLQYRNDSNRDLLVNQGDIQKVQDLEIPTVYYMFGKYSREPNRYVVTDLDMMDFCRSWLSGGNNVPGILSEALKTRYLLVLGNNYSDWLFRFIWYSIRNTPDTMRKSLILHNEIEESLYTFLDQLQTFIERDPEAVIDKMEQMVIERRKNQKVASDMHETDVFLSYSRSDKAIVERLRTALENEGLKVWFDNSSIKVGDDWKVKIRHGIRHTKLFIPILSHNVSREYFAMHEYREEWAMAAEKSRKIGGIKFIIPLAEKGFDFYNQETKLPSEFSEHDAAWYDITDNFEQFAKEIKSTAEEINQKHNRI